MFVVFAHNESGPSFLPWSLHDCGCYFLGSYGDTSTMGMYLTAQGTISILL